MKKIKHYKIKIESATKECQICGKKLNDLCSIKIWTTNITKKYTSGRPWRNCYSLKICPTCFKRFEKKLTNLILDK